MSSHEANSDVRNITSEKCSDYCAEVEQIGRSNKSTQDCYNPDGRYKLEWNEVDHDNFLNASENSQADLLNDELDDTKDMDESLEVEDKKTFAETKSFWSSFQTRITENKKRDLLNGRENLDSGENEINFDEKRNFWSSNDSSSNNYSIDVLDMDDTVIEVDAAQVKYHNVPIKANIVDNSSVFLTEVSIEQVVSKEESLAFEDLFEKLVEQDTDLNESQLQMDNKEEQSQEISTNLGQEDENLEEGQHEKARANDRNEQLDLENEGQTETRKEEMKETLRAKRLRNRTLDYHDLTPSAWSYNGQVAKYVQRTYLPDMKEKEKKEDNQEDKQDNNQESNDTGLGHGLGIILDKLRNIETKLDEIKTLEQSNAWYQDIDMDNRRLPEVGETPTIFNTDGDPEGETSIKSERKSITEEKHATEISHSKEIEYVVNMDADSDSEFGGEDGTLIIDNGSVSLASSQTEIANINEIDNEISATKEVEYNESNNVDIKSVTSNEGDNEEEVKVVVRVDDETEDEDEEESRSERIERLARKIMEEKQKLKEIETREKKIKREEDLETLSERSEDESEEKNKKNNAPKRRNRHDSERQTCSVQRRRTRSASRDRALAKIRFCWRCHRTGHESFDCRAELQPGNWCPRCLETTHWEDDCWVNDKQIYCPLCTLSGHLPCVHETADFRQRKLIVETFGWLAFKDWFTEPDFWSWWNMSGFTNVPLYKLMQRRNH